MTPATSHAVGSVDVPLLEETIGANLERAVVTYPDREALVSRHQAIRYTYPELQAAVERSRGVFSRSASSAVTASESGARTAPNGS
jgi:fatty-acyl-CoA synthase